jgi:hypothetical protein
MVRARAEIDEHLNKVLVLLTPAPGHEIVNPEDADDLVRAHLAAVRAALARFEDACHA